MYQYIWTSVKGETYSCAREPGNEQDFNAVAVMYEDRAVGHIPLSISKCISLFLTLSRSFLETKVTRKRIVRRGGHGLEVRCKYRIVSKYCKLEISYARTRESCRLDKEKSDRISIRTLACCK